MLPRIELLADEASLARGRDYFRRGRVLRFSSKADSTIDGVVEGEQFYRVHLTARSWDCDCPVGISGVFCKHCVALALAAEAGTASASPVAGTAGVENSSPPTPPRSDAPGLAEAQKTILAAFRSRRDFYDWRAIDQYVTVALAAVEHLREASAGWGAAALIPTVQKAIAATVRVIQHADDSNGRIGTVVDSLLDLHAKFCAIDPPSTKKLVDWLIDFQFDGSQDFLPRMSPATPTLWARRGWANSGHGCTACRISSAHRRASSTPVTRWCGTICNASRSPGATRKA